MDVTKPAAVLYAKSGAVQASCVELRIADPIPGVVKTLKIRAAVGDLPVTVAITDGGRVSFGDDE